MLMSNVIENTTIVPLLLLYTFIYILIAPYWFLCKIML